MQYIGMEPTDGITNINYAFWGVFYRDKEIWICIFLTENLLLVMSITSPPI